jgi:hypothetical protein
MPKLPNIHTPQDADWRGCLGTVVGQYTLLAYHARVVRKLKRWLSPVNAKECRAVRSRVNPETLLLGLETEADNRGTVNKQINAGTFPVACDFVRTVEYWLLGSHFA